MRIIIHPRDVSIDEPGAGVYAGRPGDAVVLPAELLAHDPLPRVGERIVWGGRTYTVDAVTHDYEMEVIDIRARRWPAKEVAP